MILDRTIAPPFKEVEHIEITKAKSYVLDNGVPFHTLLAGTEKVVRLELIFKAGHWYEPANGVSFFTTKLLSAGTKSLSARQIEEKIAFYGSFLEIVPGFDRSSIVLYAPAKHLNSLLPLLLEMVKESVFPDEEIENLKKISLQNYKVNLKKTSFLASINFKPVLFGKQHPYSRTIDEAAIQATRKADILSFHKSRFTSGDLDIILSGNTDEDPLPTINKYFGKEKWGQSVVNDPKFSLQTNQQNKVLIENNESVQSSIRMGTMLFSINHPDYFKVNLLIEILGGYFGSRLMKNIREEKGYTYGINASFHSLKNAGYLVIGTDVNRENTENTIKEIFNEIKVLQTELVGAEEMSIVKNYLSGSFLSSIATPFGLADKFKTLYFHGLDYDFYDKYIESLKNTTPKQLLEAANTYLNPGDLIEVVAGGK